MGTLSDQPLLVQAIFRNELEEVNKLILDGADVNVQDALGKSSLHAVAFTGNSEIADKLLLSGARPNKKDSLWLTPLHRACRNHRPEVVEVLLRHGAQVNNRNRDWQTPIHICSAHNAVECANWILMLPDKGAESVNIGDRQGRSPLHHAAVNGHLEMAQLLIDKGADVNARDKKERRPIHFAAYMGHWDLARLLVINGADPQARDKQGCTALHSAAASGQTGVILYLFGPEVKLQHTIDVDATDKEGNTPLHVAANNGKDKVAEILLANNADVNRRNITSLTPLHFAAASTDGTQCMELFLKHSADVNAVDDDGRTPLHMDAMYGRFARAMTLIEANAEIDAVDNSGNTPLHEAAKNGHDLLIRKLVEIGADVNKRGAYGMTPLHFAALHGFVDRVNCVVTHGAGIHVVDDMGRTPLHCAALSNNTNSDCVEYLIRAGADVSAGDAYGRTSLHNACVRACPTRVRHLLRAGAQPNATDQWLHTPLHLASYFEYSAPEASNLACVRFLLHAGADCQKQDKHGFLAVHLAAFKGMTAVAELLLCASSTVVQPCSRRPWHLSPLHLSSLAGHVELCKSIVSRCSRVKTQSNCCSSVPGTERDYIGRTPLHMAAMRGQLSCVRYLCGLSARGHKPQLFMTDYRGLTPLHLAGAFGYVDCVKALIESAGDNACSLLSAQDRGKRTALMLCISSGSQPCAKHMLLSSGLPSLQLTDFKARNCLHRAASFGCTDICIELLKRGVLDIGALDSDERTALHLAAANNKTDTLKVLVAALLAKEDDVSLSDKNGRSPLHWTCHHGNEQAIRLLLSDTKCAVMGDSKYTPLHCAISSDKELAAQRLLDHFGADLIHKQDVNGQTPLHIAAAKGLKVCAGLLLNYGARTDATDTHGRTPLHAAAMGGHCNVTELLLKSGSDLSATDANKNTVLHLACLSSHESLAVLILNGEPPATLLDAQNDTGKTALHVALSRGLVTVIERLVMAGANLWLQDNNERIPLVAAAPDDNTADGMEVLVAVMLQRSADDTQTHRNSSIGFNKRVSRRLRISNVSVGPSSGAQSSSDSEFF